MRRFLPAVVLGILALVVATPVQAGYIIIRIVLEGTEQGPVPVGGGLDPEGAPMGGGFPRPNPGGVLQPPNPGGVPAAPPAYDPTRSLVVVLPIEEDLRKVAPFYPMPAHQLRNPLWQPKTHLTLHNEKIVTNLFTDSSSIQWYTELKEAPGIKTTYPVDVRQRYATWAKTKTDLKVGFNLVVEALGYGMAEDAVKFADELLIAAQAKKDNLVPEVANFVRAYQPIQAGLNAPAPKRSNTDFWRVRLEAANLTPSPHYAILSWDATEDEVNRRRTLLEDNFKAFFLWHATRGIEIKLPEAPMIVVMAKQGSEVKRLAVALDAPPRLIADGFFSPEHEILVLSPERLDSLGQTFNAQTRDMYRDGITRKLLLAGRGPDIHVNGELEMRKPDDVARLQTIALIERLVEEQTTVSTISREGTLQLLFATKQFPRFVALPEWVTNGAVNFFTRPKDPAFLRHADGKWWMTVAPSPGYGVPNYVLQRQFREYYGQLLDEPKARKDLPEHRVQRAILLKNTISDAYFRGLRDPRDINDPDPVKLDNSGTALNSGGTPNGQNPGPGPGPGPNIRPPMGGIGQPPIGVGQPPIGGPGTEPLTPREEDANALMRKKRELLSVKSQATSWALYYYLAKARPEELQKFMTELSVLPRDLPLDSETLVAAFGRAFGMPATPEGLAKFADDWLNYTQTVPPVGIEIQLAEPKMPPPGTPMNPGGIPPKGPFNPGKSR